MLALSALTLSSCLHIIEDVTFNNNGSGTYKMTIDMGEIKGMMEMMKGMAPGDGDSTAIANGEAPPALPDNSMSQMGEQLSSVAASLKGIEGISKVVEVNDTSALQFGYVFEFANIAALNRALKVINKDKYDSKVDEIFKFEGKNFERLPVGDIGAEMKKALAENGGEEMEGSMDMMKMMFGDMSYKQIYHFPGRTIKKNSNSLAELSDSDHTMTITLKPFNEDQQKQNPTVAAKLKLK